MNPEPSLNKAKGLLMLDYEVIPVLGNGSIDLLGLHYLHQLNSWLYLGVGVYMPLVYGNYGGFMGVDSTIHVQRNLFGNVLINGGISFGGGGGGSGINQSKELSGTGGFIKLYTGLGYDFRNFSAGLNYSHFQFKNSLINHSQLNFFIQKPVSFYVGSYASSGGGIKSSFPSNQVEENILTLEFNNIFQVRPKGLSKKTINALALQFSHFLADNYYMFVGLDVGYQGVPLYNQVLGGVGYKFSASPRMNVYGQLGVGSGGYAPSQIDTGSGLLVYPKISLEYLLSNNIGVSLSSGYLFAPMGSSKNFTLGLGLNYQVNTKEKNIHLLDTSKDVVFKGYRFNLFQQRAFNVRVGNKKQPILNLGSMQIDKVISDNWYVPIQLNVASNAFLGFPGYGEMLVGLGTQNKFSITDYFQSFFQVLIGANVHGLILKPSIGFNYSLSDNLAIYGQLAKAMSLHKINLYPNSQKLNYDSASCGLTYRFSLLGDL